jgi:hypothetical protein
MIVDDIEWRREQCENVEKIPDTRDTDTPDDSEFICIVDGVKFCDLCRNKSGERCRYYGGDEHDRQ